MAAWPWLSLLPRGDGHPVLVFPGLGTSDLSTIPLRRFLRRMGYTNEEIAAQVGCGVRTVERRLRLIRSIWEQEGMS